MFLVQKESLIFVGKRELGRMERMEENYMVPCIKSVRCRKEGPKKLHKERNTFFLRVQFLMGEKKSKMRQFSFFIVLF